MFEKAVDFVFATEGFESNLVEDAGGYTKYGISSVQHPHVDIHNLTKDQALEIYKEEYWNACRCGEMPDAVAFLVFDSAVNQGPNAARRLLQLSVGVYPDGNLGPLTMGEINRRQVKYVLAEFTSRRSMQYALTSGYASFGLGWSRRCINAYRAALELA